MVTQLTAEMLVDLPMAREARISPDGTSVLVAVSPLSKAEEHPVSTIWLADASGIKPEQQLTTGISNDTNPRWSPDGTDIAFLSDRKKRGTSQVFVMPRSGGEGLPVTDEPGGVSDFCWIPGDVRRIAYLAVDARDDETKRQREDERKDANVYGEFWPFARLVTLDLDSQEIRRYDTGDKHIASLAPSPNGLKLAITLWDTPEIDNILATSQLTVVDLGSGTLNMAGPRGFNTDSLAWSSDCKSLYFFAIGGDTVVSSYQLWTVDLEEGSDPRCLTRDLQSCVYGVYSGRNSDEVLALVAEGTETVVCAITPEDNVLQKRIGFSGDIRDLAVSDDGLTIAYIGSTATLPGDVYVWKPDNRENRVTNFHPWLDDVALGPQEVIHWERNGLTLDGILIWPPDTSRESGPLPAVVSLHGGPYGRWANGFMASAFGRWLAAQGYLVFMPNPRGGMGHGQAFAESVLCTVGDEDYLDIMAGVDVVIEQGIADPERLACGGWSQGGFMTAWIVGQTSRFKAGVMGAGISDWGMMIATSDVPTYENLMGGGNPYESIGPHSFDKQSPISYVHQATTPTLIVHGEQDERVPVSQGIFFHRGLRTYNVPVELVTYPREPHGIEERNHQLDLFQRVADWYQRWNPA